MFLFGKKDNSAPIRSANALLASAKVASQQNRKTEALELLRQAAVIAEKIGKPADEVRYAATYSSATVHLSERRFDAALAALDITTQIIIANRWNYSRKHFDVMIYHSKILYEKGDLQRAISVLTHAQQELRNLANPELAHCLGRVLENLTGIFLNSGQLAQAVQWLAIAEQHATQFGFMFPFVWSRIFFHKMKLWSRTGASPDELKQIRAIAADIKLKIGTSHAAVALVDASLATALYRAGMMEESQALFEIVRGQLRLESGLAAQGLVWNGLGMIYLEKKNYAEAESMFRRSLNCRENRSDTQKSIALNNLGVAIRDQGRIAEADSLLRQAVALAESAVTPDHVNWANAMKNLGQNCQAAGNLEEASQLYRAAISRFEQSTPVDDSATAKFAETRNLLSALRT